MKSSHSDSGTDILCPEPAKVYSAGREFFRSSWGDEEMEIHSSCVIDAALAMISGTTLDPCVFIAAGWLHDLGRRDDVKNHHVTGLAYLEEFQKRFPSCRNIKKEIADSILNHRSSGKPETVYGRIMQAADKAAMYSFKWIEYCQKREGP